MKTTASLVILTGFVACGLSMAQNAGDGYTNFIRQVQLPSDVVWDVTVGSSGEQLSALPINPNGARFELHTVKASPLTSYLLDTKYVGSYIPIGQVAIRSEDPETTIPRTRADRPFYVDITVAGLRNGAEDPVASKSVKLLRHVQSYGTTYGQTVNRSQATLLSQATVNQNGTQTLTYAVNSIPGADRSKVRGEERFSIFSQADYQAPESQLASMFIQIWPVADGSISGVTAGQTIRFSAPPVTFRVNDVYPEARVYAQVYKGGQALGTEGFIVPGSARIYNDSIPQTHFETVANWDNVINSDGTWTMELLTSTPFGIDRLAHVTFIVDRTISVNGSVTTIE